MTNRIRVGVFRGKVRAVMIYPVIIENAIVAYVCFCESTKERIWTENEIGFAKDVTGVVNRMIRFTDAEETSDNANKDLLEDPKNPNVIEPGVTIKIPSIKGEVRTGTYDPKKEYQTFKK